MLNNSDILVPYLKALNLSTDESKLYLELLKGPNSHLELARTTGINRTKVYRLAEQLEKRSLVNTQTDDRGTLLVAADPATLEVQLVTEEEKLKNQRAVFNQLLPALSAIKKESKAGATNFAIQTFEGVAGLKQMLWNELKTKGEICIFAYETLDDVAGQRWAEKYRSLMVERNLPHRVIENIDAKHVLEHTKVNDYKQIYQVRYLPRNILDIQQEVTIHNNVVSIYNWNKSNKDLKIGLEIHSRQFASFMKSTFELYWQTAAAVDPKN